MLDPVLQHVFTSLLGPVDEVLLQGKAASGELWDGAVAGLNVVIQSPQVGLLIARE